MHFIVDIIDCLPHNIFNHRYFGASPCFSFLINLIMLNWSRCATLIHFKLFNIVFVGVYRSHFIIILMALFCSFCIPANWFVLLHANKIVEPYSKCDFIIVLYIFLAVDLGNLLIILLKKLIFFQLFWINNLFAHWHLIFDLL